MIKITNASTVTCAVGSTIRVSAAGSTKNVRVVALDGLGQLLGSNGAILEGETLGGKAGPLRATVRVIRECTPEEVVDFDQCLRAVHDADDIDLHGAPRFAKRLTETGLARIDRIEAAIEALEGLGKYARVSQLRAFLIREAPGFYSSVEGVSL